MSEAQESIALNPFVVGGALGDVKGYGFFGREDVFSFVESSLNVVQRAPIILFGHRRIGKSSILKRLMYRLSPGLTCVYFDLQGRGNSPMDAVLYGLGRAIADTLGIPRPEREEATEDTFEPVFLTRATSKLDNPRRLVLLLDEFDVIDETRFGPTVAAKNFIPFLGRLISVRPQLGVILVLGRNTNELSEIFNSSLLKDAVQKRIGRLSASEVSEMIHALADRTLIFGEDAIERILELTAGHPFCSQVLCHAIWGRCIGKTNDVTPRDVDDAVFDAIEQGTNGMTWIYDGLQSPEQRLFLSALSETANPLSRERATRDSIQMLLRNRRLALEQVRLDSAARDLCSWDVIEGSSEAGYRFVVAILGAWVQQERPVLQLEREMRFANPRAWSFYELALDSEQRGELDAAIADYRNALQANPLFLDAQRSFASALHKRGKRGDLPAAIEAWERVVELDSAGPKTELLDALMAGLEAAKTLTFVRPYSQRILALDPNGIYRERALRNLKQRATTKMAIGSAGALKDAIELYDLIGDSEGKTYAEEIVRKQNRLSNIAITALFVFPALAIGLGFIPFLPQMPDVRIVCAGLGGMIFSWGPISEQVPRLSAKHIGLPWLLAGIGIGELIWHLAGSLGWAGFAAWLLAYLNVTSAPTLPDDAKEDVLAPDQGESRGLAGLIVGILDEIAKRTSRLRDIVAAGSR